MLIKPNIKIMINKNIKLSNIFSSKETIQEFKRRGGNWIDLSIAKFNNGEIYDLCKTLINSLIENNELIDLFDYTEMQKAYIINGINTDKQYFLSNCFSENFNNAGLNHKVIDPNLGFDIKEIKTAKERFIEIIKNQKSYHITNIDNEKSINKHGLTNSLNYFSKEPMLDWNNDNNNDDKKLLIMINNSSVINNIYPDPECFEFDIPTVLPLYRTKPHISELLKIGVNINSLFLLALYNKVYETNIWYVINRKISPNEIKTKLINKQ